MRAAPLAPCALLGLVLAAVGCGSKPPAITGLTVDVTMSNLAADQLQFDVTTPDGTSVMAARRPQTPNGNLADQQSVSIFLPDSLVGQVATCTVTPLLRGGPVAAPASASATLVFHVLVNVSVELDGGTDGAAGAGGGGGSGGAGGAGGTGAAGAGGGGGAGGAAGANDGGAGAGTDAAPDGPGTKALGAPCASPSECDSTLCVDGVCCASECGTLCEACNLPGKAGVCTPLPVGMAPAATATQKCAPQPIATCGFDGTCDGNGGCRHYPAGTQCQAASCNSASFVPASACDGQGACVAAKPVDCAPYKCGGTTPACLTTCTVGGTDCLSPAVCAGGSCGARPKQGLGAGCVADGDCLSGHCADGVCCASACTGPCTACNQPGLGGMCLAVALGKPDPHNVCKDAGATSCMQNGLCDSAGGCALYPATTTCASGSCTKALLHPAHHCDGKGACVVPTDTDCTPWRCDPATTACFTSCQNSTVQCAPRHLCLNMTCQ
jgi:hypothetical protein